MADGNVARKWMKERIFGGVYTFIEKIWYDVKQRYYLRRDCEYAS